MISKETVADASYEDYEQEQQKLLREIRDIQFKLSSRDKRDTTGRRLSGMEYFQWRGRALYALKVREERLAEIKIWLKTHSRGASCQEQIGRSLRQVLQEAQALIRSVDLRDRDGYEDSLEGLRDAVDATVELFRQS